MLKRLPWSIEENDTIVVVDKTKTVMNIDMMMWWKQRKGGSANASR